ncbi:MAG: hypothetical protein K5920_08115 [Bacteroidales bacterium]|nr:hypothetical protein [Bacteroidales bacterium]
MDYFNKHKKWDITLQEEYKRLWPNMERFNWDGVVSPEDYAKANIKVMFLNRETYGDDYNINEAIKKEIDNNLVMFGNNPIKVKTKNRLRVLSLLEKDVITMSDSDFEQYLNSYSEEDFRKDMLKVAYCNIKKSDGNEKSSRRNLYECALRNKEILQKQISFFNPSIIIGGNIVDGILEKIMEWGDDLYTPESHYVNIFTLSVNGEEYPFVDAYHPSSRKNNYVDSMELFRALQSVERDHPGYWKSRCGLTCFSPDQA